MPWGRSIALTEFDKRINGRLFNENDRGMLRTSGGPLVGMAATQSAVASVKIQESTSTANNSRPLPDVMSVVVRNRSEDNPSHKPLSITNSMPAAKNCW